MQLLSTFVFNQDDETFQEKIGKWACVLTGEIIILNVNHIN